MVMDLERVVRSHYEMINCTYNATMIEIHLSWLSTLPQARKYGKENVPQEPVGPLRLFGKTISGPILSFAAPERSLAMIQAREKQIGDSLMYVRLLLHHQPQMNSKFFSGIVAL